MVKIGDQELLISDAKGQEVEDPWQQKFHHERSVFFFQLIRHQILIWRVSR